jgi:hypothetical protein
VSTARRQGTAGAPRIAAAGDWQRQPDCHCTLCGRLLIRRHLVEDDRVFCDSDCAGLYRSYWLPRYGGTRGGG